MAQCSEQTWLMRYEGVVETRVKLKEYLPALKLDGSYKLDIFEELLAALDIYAMNLRATTLSSDRYEFKTDGRLKLPAHVEHLCEAARHRVHTLVTRLMLKEGSPVLLENSRMYAKLKGFQERKELVIHPFEAKLSEKVKRLKVDITKSATCSEGTDTSLPRYRENKFELLRSEFEPESLVPLYYALRVIKKHGQKLNEKNLNKEPPSKQEISKKLSRIKEFVDKLGPDRSRRIQEVIEDIC
jgi:hypothetical protein